MCLYINGNFIESNGWDDQLDKKVQFQPQKSQKLNFRNKNDNSPKHIIRKFEVETTKDSDQNRTTHQYTSVHHYSIINLRK